ncbi:MAG: hypothetical protein LH649_18370, partial [Pseudanabaena sp. CAN_BIN31]|nr:hypothetical protein [Pseudanabaena sp. CAN_BIN31]
KLNFQKQMRKLFVLMGRKVLAISRENLKPKKLWHMLRVCHSFLSFVTLTYLQRFTQIAWFGRSIVRKFSSKKSSYVFG